MISPAFASWQDFFAMGGYAAYVWLSAACALLAPGALLLHTVLQRRRLLAEIRQQQAREQRLRAAKSQRSAAATGAQP